MSYKYLKDISVGDKINISYNDFEDMTRVNIEASNVNLGRSEWGFTDLTLDWTPGFFYFYEFADDNYHTYYPKGIFNRYLSVTSLVDKDNSTASGYTVYSENLTTTIKQLDNTMLSHTLYDDGAKVSISGSVFDYMDLKFSSENLTWVVYQPYSTEVEYHLPLIPKEISDKYFEGKTRLPINNVSVGIQKSNEISTSFSDILNTSLFGKPYVTDKNLELIYKNFNYTSSKVGRLTTPSKERHESVRARMLASFYLRYGHKR